MYLKKKETKNKRIDSQKRNKTHTYIMHMQKRKRMLLRITFFQNKFNREHRVIANTFEEKAMFVFIRLLFHQFEWRFIRTY